MLSGGGESSEVEQVHRTVYHQVAQLTLFIPVAALNPVEALNFITGKVV